MAKSTLKCGWVPIQSRHPMCCRQEKTLNARKEKLMRMTVLKKSGADLPFFLKVLPTSRPLLDFRLLTAHWPRSSLWPRHFLRIRPDKDLAAHLHQKDPGKYSDENHKPEIAVALTTFELFVDFKPLNGIQTLLHLSSPAPIHTKCPNTLQ
jgi:mannose-6-phosphate isomerase